MNHSGVILGGEISGVTFRVLDLVFGLGWRTVGIVVCSGEVDVEGLLVFGAVSVVVGLADGCGFASSASFARFLSFSLSCFRILRSAFSSTVLSDRPALLMVSGDWALSIKIELSLSWESTRELPASFTMPSSWAFSINVELSPSREPAHELAKAATAMSQ